MLAGFGVLITVIPLVYLGVRVSQAETQAIGKILTSGRTWELLTNSLLLVAAVTATAVVVGSLQAFFITKTDLRFRSLFAALAVFPLAIPSYIAAFSWISFFPGFEGFGAAWLVLSFGTAPYVFLAVSASLLMTNTSLEEVAQSLGKSQWATVREVIWPSVRPAAIGAALVVALYTLSDFGAVSLVRYDTFTRGIFNAYRSSFDRTGAALLSAIVVIVTIAIVLMQRRLTPTTNASSKSARRSPMRLRTGRGPAYALLVSAGTLGVGIPLMSMTRWTIVGASSADFGQLSRAIINTFGFAFAGAAVTTIFAFAISLVVSRYVTRTGKFLDTAMWIGHALPGIVVALSFVFMANSLVPAIYQTSTLVVIAYVALFVPNAVVALTTPIQQISMGLEDVARTLGVSRLGAIFKVVIPVARPALLTSFSLIALTIIKELPATLLLRPTGIETLATRLWTQTGINAFSAAAPYALMLVVLAGIPALLLNRQVRQTFSPTTSLRSSEVKS